MDDPYVSPERQPGAHRPPLELHCAECGYDLRGTAVGHPCPECGLPVEETIRIYRDTGGGNRKGSSGTAVAVLVLGIACLVLCAPLGIVAIILGFQVRREYAPGSSAHSMATVGWILGWVGVILTGGMLGFWLLSVAIGGF